MEVGSTLLSGFVGGLLGAGTKEFVAFFFHEIGRRRAEQDAIESELLSKITEARDFAIVHWSEAENAQGAKVRAGQIVGRIHYCASLYPELFESTLEEKRRTDVLFQDFRKTLTGGDFGVVARPAQPEKTTEIEMATYELKSQIRLGKIRCRKRFPNLSRKKF